MSGADGGAGVGRAGSAERPLFVATDVDGTLIDGADRVPGANATVIDDVVASGAHFVLATGRPPRWLPQVVDQLPVAPMAVCANGAVVLDTATDRVLVSHELDPEVLAELDELVRRCLPGCGVAAERVGTDAADAEFVACPDYRHAWLHPEHLQVGRAEVVAQPALKLLARLPGAASGAMVAALDARVRELADVTYSTTDGLIEFAVRGVTKASALAELARDAGVVAGVAAKPATGGGGAVPATVAFGAVPATVAFGDMPNDIEMLRWAELGVAMGNALPEVKAEADEVTLTNDAAGLAAVLRRWW